MQRVATKARKGVPLALSKISAGPSTEIMTEHSQLDINALVTGGREGFVAYEVTGDSMADQIPPGSIIFVDTWVEPRHGDVIASSVNGLVNVKIFQQTQNGRLYLVPANEKYAPREITNQDSFQILGVVKSCLSVVSAAKVQYGHGGIAR